MAIAYPIVLLAMTLVIRAFGETWWATDIALYLPRVLFAIPLPFLTAALLAYRARRLLLTQLAAALVVLFPLMGFVLPWFSGKNDGEPVVRVLSYNVNSGYGGLDKLMEEIDGYSPDVVLLQELFTGTDHAAEMLRAKYPVVQTSTQFLLASRFPLLSSFDPERLPHEGRMRSPRFVQYVLDTPLGPVAFYNVHPVSPRHGIYRLRGAGLRREILSGRFFAGENASVLMSDSSLRGEQVEAFAHYADQENQPVVIAGDTNLPGLSAYLRKHLSRYNDGFREAGWGFGYTFPANHRTWMRLDRIFASDELRFVGFQTGDSRLSDHFCVVADLQKKRR